jgi:hypothetical protein
LKKYSISLVIKEMQIKIRVKLHFTLVRTVSIKNTNNNKYWQECREKGTRSAGGNVN